MKKIILPIVCVFFTLSNLLAAEIKPYIGFDFMGTSYEFNDDDIDGTVYSSSGFNVGLQFHKNIAVELFYYGSEEKNLYYIINNTQQIIYPVKSVVNTYGVDLGGIRIVNEKVDSLASVGYATYKFEEKVDASKNSAHDNVGSFLVGLGLQYHFT